MAFTPIDYSMYSSVAYTGDGTTKDFIVPFPYLYTEDVHVTVNGTEATVYPVVSHDNPPSPFDAHWYADNLIRFVSAPEGQVKIYRETNRATPEVEFTNSAILTEEDLNTVVTQLMYIVQESYDNFINMYYQLTASKDSAIASADRAEEALQNTIQAGAEIIDKAKEEVGEIADRAEDVLESIEDDAAYIRKYVQDIPVVKSSLADVEAEDRDGLFWVPGAFGEPDIGTIEQIKQNEKDVAEVKKSLDGKADKGDLTQINDALSQFKGEAENTHRNIEKQTADLQRKVTNLRHILNKVDYVEEQDDTEAYSKTVPSGAAPWAAIESIGGKTLVWNQQAKVTGVNATTLGGISITKADNGETLILNGTANANFNFRLEYGANKKLLGGHKYYIRTVLAKGGAGLFSVSDSWSSAFTDLGDGGIISNTSDFIIQPIMYVAEGATLNNVKVTYQIIDLTLMFGAGNEPTTVEEVEAIIGTGYHPYNAGELVSGDVNEVVSSGRNIVNVQDAQSTIVNGYYSEEVISKDLSLFESGKTYIVSFDYECNSSVTPISQSVGLGRGNSLYSSDLRTVLTSQTKGTANIPFVIIDAYKSEYNKLAIRPLRFSGNAQNGTVVRIRNIQITKGSDEFPYAPYHEPIKKPIPETILALPGYGWSAGTAKNWVDYQRKEYHQEVGRYIVTGRESYVLNWKPAIVFEHHLPNKIKRYGGTISNAGIVFTASSSVGNAFQFNISDIGLSNDATAEQVSNYFKNNETVINFELAEPIVTDISDLIPDDWECIEVEAGGTVEFKSSTDLRIPVPSTITYDISTKEAI